MCESDETLPLKKLIGRVSAHLDGLAAEVHAIEYAIGEKLDQKRYHESDYIKRVQRLDYVRQSLEDLALLNLFIAERCQGELNEKIPDSLNLATTKELLNHYEAGRKTVDIEAGLGDVDLF